MACETIRAELGGLIDERNDWQVELQTASPPMKPFIVVQIKRLNRQIALKRLELDACLGVGPTPQSLPVVFTGTATLTTTYGAAPGPYAGPVTVGLLFSASRTSFWITSFSPITTPPFPTPVGNNVTTVSMLQTGTGNFDQASGHMGISLTSRFDHSIDLPFYEEDSTLPLLLGTGSLGGLAGSPLNRSTGAITFVGSGVFQGGILGGSTGTIVMSGALAPIP